VQPLLSHVLRRVGVEGQRRVGVGCVLRHAGGLRGTAPERRARPGSRRATTGFPNLTNNSNDLGMPIALRVLHNHATRIDHLQLRLLIAMSNLNSSLVVAVTRIEYISASTY